ncbi:MAG: hypothetical protein OXI47_06735 [Gammaproteobacteria bacterium]|nr:hypothetical protein [Gammaproteobacteria bacterium]
MPDDERKGRAAFCYAVALAAKALDRGEFEGLNCETFLNHLERLLEMEIPDLGEAPASYARSHLACTRRFLVLHQGRPERASPNLRLVWSRDPD